MASIAETLAVAVKQHQAGRLEDAERIYRQILQAEPEQPSALHLLGVLAHQVGRHEAAIECIGRAISLNPNVAVFHSDLGIAHRALGELNRAVASYQRALQIDPDHADAHYNLGNVLRQQGRLDEAEACYRRALAIRPSHPQANHNLGGLLKHQGHLEEAAASYRRAVEAKPDFAEAHYNLGMVLRVQGNLAPAAVCFQQALDLRPEYIEAQIELGGTFYDLKKLSEAAAAFRRAIEIRPDSAAAHYNLGITLFDAGQPHDAIACYRRALDLKPDYAEAHNNLGTALKEQGKFDEAIGHFRKAIALDPLQGQAYANLAHAKRFADTDLPEFRQLEELLARNDLPREMQSEMHFALGKICDDRQEWDRAFSHYEAGNRLIGASFDVQAHIDRITALIDAFVEKLPAGDAAPGRDSQLPIFIVGMLRSATTLAEQILSSHPAVFGAGELLDMPAINAEARSMLQSPQDYPRGLLQMDPRTACRLADKYLDRLRELGGDALRVADKLPTNFLRLGLIALLLPGARIIHCRRHPLDVCLSCYFRNFHHRLPFTTDLYTLGVYYRQYERLMDHWRSVLPIPVFEVDYEQLVENQEEVSRRLIEFCGLDWHPNCLSFHTNDRVVRTASNWQVRQPMYARSVERWKNYQKFLDPLKKGLGWSY